MKLSITQTQEKKSVFARVSNYTIKDQTFTSPAQTIWFRSKIEDDVVILETMNTIECRILLAAMYLNNNYFIGEKSFGDSLSISLDNKKVFLISESKKYKIPNSAVLKLSNPLEFDFIGIEL